jgi:hypothetical protein
MNALGMVYNQCDIRHKVWSDSLLNLNRKILDDIMIAERNHFTSSSLNQFGFNPQLCLHYQGLEVRRLAHFVCSDTLI